MKLLPYTSLFLVTYHEVETGRIFQKSQIRDLLQELSEQVVGQGLARKHVHVRVLKL